MTSTAIVTSNRHVVIDSPIGELTLVRDDVGLTGLYFPGHWTKPDQTSFGPAVNPDEDRGFGQAIIQLGEYFAGERREFALSLNPHGSPLARRVWRLLAEIPYGRTTTYGALAAQLDDSISPRDVGGLVGHNPLSIVVPCHRVIGATGKLTGYAGGLERKRQLLELEQAIPASLPALW